MSNPPEVDKAMRVIIFNAKSLDRDDPNRVGNVVGAFKVAATGNWTAEFAEALDVFVDVDEVIVGMKADTNLLHQLAQRVVQRRPYPGISLMFIKAMIDSPITEDQFRVIESEVEIGYRWLTFPLLELLSLNEHNLVLSSELVERIGSWIVRNLKQHSRTHWFRLAARGYRLLYLNSLAFVGEEVQMMSMISKATFLFSRPSTKRKACVQLMTTLNKVNLGRFWENGIAMGNLEEVMMQLIEHPRVRPAVFEFVESVAHHCSGYRIDLSTYLGVFVKTMIVKILEYNREVALRINRIRHMYFVNTREMRMAYLMMRLEQTNFPLRHTWNYCEKVLTLPFNAEEYQLSYGTQQGTMILPSKFTHTQLLAVMNDNRCDLWEPIRKLIDTEWNYADFDAIIDWMGCVARDCRQRRFDKRDQAVYSHETHLFARIVLHKLVCRDMPLNIYYTNREEMLSRKIEEKYGGELERIRENVNDESPLLQKIINLLQLTTPNAILERFKYKSHRLIYLVLIHSVLDRAPKCGLRLIVAVVHSLKQYLNSMREDKSASLKQEEWDQDCVAMQAVLRRQLELPEEIRSFPITSRAVQPNSNILVFLLEKRVLEVVWKNPLVQESEEFLEWLVLRHQVYQGIKYK